MVQPPEVNISSAGLSERPDLDITNIYYEILSEEPKLKYCYNMEQEIENGVLRCDFSYMAYKTGIFPEGEYITAESLGDLLTIATDNLGAEKILVKLLDSQWSPDEINSVLSQVGFGYILCSLNRDGSGLVYTPPVGMTIEECMNYIDEINTLAGDVVKQLVTDGMTDREKAETLFSYITERVKYDDMYYDDRENMSYHSQTALGALRDNVAICGGYAGAVKVLFEKAGIPCVTVKGKYFTE